MRQKSVPEVDLHEQVGAGSVGAGRHENTNTRVECHANVRRELKTELNAVRLVIANLAVGVTPVVCE